MASPGVSADHMGVRRQLNVHATADTAPVPRMQHLVGAADRLPELLLPPPKVLRSQLCKQLARLVKDIVALRTPYEGASTFTHC